VDVSLNDLTHSHAILLSEDYPRKTDQALEATGFIKELLVPGSTKQFHAIRKMKDRPVTACVISLTQFVLV
jgi:hypothetical protein